MLAAVNGLHTVLLVISNLSLCKGTVPHRWKDAKKVMWYCSTSSPIFKKGNMHCKVENYRPGAGFMNRRSSGTPT